MSLRGLLLDAEHGGTGTAPVIVDVARSLGCLTVGVVTRPFNFEGKCRGRQAEQGIVELKTSVDTLITIPNEKLIAMAGESTSMLDAFTLVDLVLHNAVQGISDLVVVRGLINVDFADVRTVMQNQGLALMGTGRATGPKTSGVGSGHLPLILCKKALDPTLHLLFSCGAWTRDTLNPPKCQVTRPDPLPFHSIHA